jgi:sortase (surface protein transpeptidase)
MDTHSTKKFSWRLAILLCLGAGLFAVVISVLFQVRSEAIKGVLADSPSSATAVLAEATTTSPAVSLGSSYDVPGKPVRLIIPAIGVNANVQSVGLFWNGDGDMSIPTNFTDVAWYNGGPRPGMPGNAVIDGHLDGRNVKEAVFYKLGDLQPGDMVEVVDAAGKMWDFKVMRLEDYAYTATTTDIFSGDNSAARLNLITCAGDWITSENGYNERVVVFTQLVPGVSASS